MKYFVKSKIAMSVAGTLIMVAPALAGTLDEIVVTGTPGKGVSKF